MCTPMMRRLTCKNETLVESYNTLTISLLKSNKVEHHLEKLEASFRSIDLDHSCVKLNVIDK